MSIWIDSVADFTALWAGAALSGRSGTAQRHTLTGRNHRRCALKPRGAPLGAIGSAEQWTTDHPYVMFILLHQSAATAAVLLLVQVAINDVQRRLGGLFSHR